MKQLFGTDGIRGRANQWPITPELALKAGRAIARTVAATRGGKRKIVIGKDTRLSGYMLETALTSGLVAEGATVLLVGPMPTPAVAHLARSMDCVAGIMLTASHNPYEDNGLKIFGGDGFKLNDVLERQVEELLLGPDLTSPPGGAIGKAFRIDDAMGRYIEFVKNAMGAYTLEGLKVVVDCANGAAYFMGPLILEELGAEVIPLSTAPDGRNINADCGALHPERAAERVRATGADLGIAFDGDADRVIFIDETGTVVNGDRILALCAREWHARGRLRGDTLVTTVMANLGLHEAMEAAGIRVVTTPVGDRHVIEALRAGSFAFGGENSGHIIFLDYGTTGDGIMSALQVMSLMRQRGARLSELGSFMREFPQRLINLPVREKVPLEAIPRFQEALRASELELGRSGRILVRYSGTELKVRVLVETAEAERSDAHAERLATILRAEIGA
jgi:phosphoglucosamine mutase